MTIQVTKDSKVLLDDQTPTHFRQWGQFKSVQEANDEALLLHDKSFPEASLIIVCEDPQPLAIH